MHSLHASAKATSENLVLCLGYDSRHTDGSAIGGLSDFAALKRLSVQSYVLLGAEDEGLNPGIWAKKVLGRLLLLGLRNLRVHCCAEDTEVNSAREMFLRRVGASRGRC